MAYAMASRLCNSSARAGPWLAIHWEMQTMSDPDPQVVLIVGTGPAGLFAACELASPWRQAARCRAQTRAASRDARDRAATGRAGDHRPGGLIEPFLRAGVRIRQIQLLGPGLREIAQRQFRGHGLQIRVSMQPAAMAHRGDPARTSGGPWHQDRIRHRSEVDRRRSGRPARDARSRRPNGGFHDGLRAWRGRCSQHHAAFDAGASRRRNL